MTSKKPFVTYDKDDDALAKGKPTGQLTCYDIIAKTCSSSTANLQSYAKIRRLTPNCRLYDNIQQYVVNSSASGNMKVERIFKINRTGERGPFAEKYRIMLWHGTSPQAIPGIIQTGFRMGTGGLFGGGIYFADRIAKSAGYAGKSQTGTYFFILAEVAPGKVYKSHHTHSNYTTAPTGFDSVKGMGSQIPTWKENKDYGGAVLPCGKTTQNQRHQQYDMPWNEYIMYDPNRIIIRFVVECTY